MKKIFLLFALSLLLMNCSNSNKNKKQQSFDSYLVVGTYTHKTSEGVYLYKFNTETGKHSLASSLKIDNPSFVTVAENGKLYIATENEDIATDKISVAELNKETGKMNVVNSELTQGVAPCYVLVDEGVNKVISANYGGGSISLFSLQNDGLLDKGVDVRTFNTPVGPNTARQDAQHLHCIYLSPDNKYLFANDLGADCIYQFEVDKLDEKVEPKIIALKPGSGPRHTVFHPNKKWAYTITELSGEVMAFAYANGTLNLFQTILADPNKAQGSADIQITPDGKYLYASNRLKDDGVAIFEIAGDGTLTSIGYQKTGVHPRNMVITPNGKFLLVACRDTDSIEVYEIQPETGALINTNQDIKVSMPVCLKFTSLN